MAVRVVRVVRGVSYIKRVESKNALIHVLTTTEETSQAQAVLKLFFASCWKEERRKKMNSSLLPNWIILQFAAGKKL